MYRIGWFSTGRDEAARDLLRTICHSIEKGEIGAQIVFVFSSREPGEHGESDLFFELVRSYKIPLVCLSSTKYQHRLGRAWRPDFEKEAMRLLEGFHFDLGVLAGYMLIVGKEMCHRYPLVNLHPAAPGGPKGTWQEVVWKLIEERASQTGVMMHLVTPELDEGPPVTYCTFSLRGELFDRYWKDIEGKSIAEIKANEGEKNALFLLIRKHGLAREFPLIIATVKALSEGKVRIQGGMAVDGAGKAIEGYNLTDEIEQKVKEAVL
jgi:folate-dependent phosphoribosylglycinamide formyltransferase PurN